MEIAAVGPAFRVHVPYSLAKSDLEVAHELGWVQVANVAFNVFEEGDVRNKVARLLLEDSVYHWIAL